MGGWGAGRVSCDLDDVCGNALRDMCGQDARGTYRGHPARTSSPFVNTSVRANNMGYNRPRDQTSTPTIYLTIT